MGVCTITSNHEFDTKLFKYVESAVVNPEVAKPETDVISFKLILLSLPKPIRDIPSNTAPANKVHIITVSMFKRNTLRFTL